MLLPLLALMATPTVAPEAFAKYLARKEPAFAYRATASGSETRIDLTSQTWQGAPWQHTILLRQPPTLAHKGIAILYITGDGPKPADYADLALIVGATGLPVASLFNVPNQPIYGLKEDDLIAHTFEKYLETGDPTWPLLFPMAKSAIKAMDAIQAATKNTANPIKKFLVAGGSKRGWTTWFVGASRDPRVLGIAPMVIDNLNVAKQMPHQLASWGRYSEQIEEYTRRGLQQKLETPKGQVLARMIDPYHYLDQIRVPTLIVNGANDPYWTVDALSLYWNDLKMPHWATIVPNAGHDLGNKVQAVEAVGAFARALAGEFPMPKIEWSLKDRGIQDGKRVVEVEALSERLPYEQLRVLLATSDTLDFRPSRWEAAAESRVSPSDRKAPSRHRILVAAPADKNVAVLAEVRYRVGARSFTLSRPVTVLRKG